MTGFEPLSPAFIPATTADEVDALWVARVSARVEGCVDRLADGGLADGRTGDVVAGADEAEAHHGGCDGGRGC